MAPIAITEAVNDLGYTAIPFDPAAAEDADDGHGRFLLRCMAVAGFASANIMLLSVSVWAAHDGEMGEATRALLHLISALIAIPAVAFAGRPFFQSAWKALRHGRANMDVPISLAVFLALGVSLFEALSGGEHAYFDAAVMLLFFLLIGRWLDHRLRTKARSAARDLLALQATTALRLDDNGHAEAVSARDIRPGDKLVVQPGTRLPVNAEVIEGTSDLDVAFLTGETLPRLASQGDTVLAGARNLSSRLVVKATSDTATSVLSDLVRLVEAGQQAKDQYTILADKAARAYVPIVHSLAALTVAGWLLLGGSVREAVMAATATLIITCPCALGLATPAVQVVATGELFRRGVLVKSGNALERLARIRHVVFDKTGTLTEGRLEWTNAEILSPRARSAAFALARAGLHPIARSIAASAGPGVLAEDVTEVPGEGLSGRVSGETVKIGRAGFVGIPEEDAGSAGPQAWLKVGDDEPVLLTFEDRVRADGRATIEALRDAGITVSLLSGDKEAAVRAVAETLGIEQYRSEVRPEDKAEFISELKKSGSVAMVGDGINDAPALALADVSLSPGTAADAAQSAADFVFQGEGISAVHQTWRMARRARRHILQNFAFAAVYNLVAAPAAMAGLVTPLIAALAMSGSSMVVTLNALRLKTHGGNP
ncbi:copper-translocating P-type ATPase [Parvularcula lutaonensis]|nr:copper-translocating P-type ATPase [Parvularcula lutaonensis]